MTKLQKRCKTCHLLGVVLSLFQLPPEVPAAAPSVAPAGPRHRPRGARREPRGRQAQRLRRRVRQAQGN